MTVLTSAAVRHATHRWGHTRFVRACAYRLGKALGEQPRVLRGTVETGSPILLSSRDHSHRHVFFYASYEPEITVLFKRLVTPGMTVLDVGANAGYFALVCSDLGAAVHAFEPDPVMAALMRRSVSLAGAKVTVVAAACSDHEGVAPLYLSDEGHTAISSLKPDAGGLGARSVAVPVVTLDRYVSRAGIRPDLVKIDVERHELGVIRGARRMLRELRPDLIVEITASEVLEELLDHGYRAWIVTRDGMRPTTDMGPDGWGNVYLSAA
jgi:FkbM family methyltransferase